jgi:tryptophan-rich sensory protein
MISRILIFLLINFAALAIGGLFTSKAVSSDWYLQLNKAPWTPPGWVFGAAWFTIMVCFAIYMAQLYSAPVNTNLLIGLFCIQWLLNVIWNPVFFYFHATVAGLFVITALTILVGYMLFFYFPTTKFISLLLMPYFVWLLIATSLNAYIVFRN